MPKPISVGAVRGLVYGVLTALVSVAVALTPADVDLIGPAAPILALFARIAEAALLDTDKGAA